MAFEELCKNLEDGPNVMNQEFINAFSVLQDELQVLTNQLSPDASVWYNYYLVQTYGILKESFPEFDEDFDEAVFSLDTAVEGLQDEALQENWKLKVNEMFGK